MSEKDKEELQNHSSVFSKIKSDLLRHKRLYLVGLPLVLALTVAYTLSLPDYFICTVKLSPELSGSKTSSSLSSLASGLGVDLGSALGSSSDAIRPALYPEVMASPKFRVELLKVRVRRKDGEQFTYYDYLKDGQKPPLLSFSLKRLFASSDTVQNSAGIDPHRLTKRQAGVVKLVGTKMTCNVNKKTSLITIQVTDNDPEVCATIADSAMALLQRFITDYRTSKARVDLEYSRKMVAEAKVNYEKFSREYARNVDANLNSFVEEIRQRRLNMETELQVQRNIYQQVVARAKQAELKVQEDTPAFAVVQASTVPVRKSGPRRGFITLFMFIVGVVGITSYILFKEGDLKVFTLSKTSRRKFPQQGN